MLFGIILVGMGTIILNTFLGNSQIYLMVIEVHGGGAWPSFNKYLFPRPVTKTFNQVEIPAIMRPPRLQPCGARNPIAENFILWRLLDKIR